MATKSRSSFEISFSDLWTYVTGPSGDRQRASLSELAGAGEHIHGLLEILVQGRCLPSLGFFGPDDVCLNEWARELMHLSKTVGADGAAAYVYDEGEQGQPSYHFAKVGDEVIVSVRNGLGGGQADPEWHGVSCRLTDVTDAIAGFSKRLESAVVSAAGQRGQEWFTAVLGE